MTNMAVSQMRMPTRGLIPVFSAEERRLLVLRQGVGPGFSPKLLFLAENIPHAPRRVAELGVARAAPDLLAQDAAVDVARAPVAPLAAPHPPQERAPREHPAGARRERHEELELGVGEVHLLVGDGDPAAREVYAQPVVVELVRALARRYRGPAHDSPHPRHQLPHGERLGDVVVGPELQPHDPIYLVVLGCQHDDGHVALRPDAPAHLRAVQLGEHDVQDYEVRLVALERLEGLLAVANRLDLETLPL